LRIGSTLTVAGVVLALFATEATASPGFEVPSGNTTCAILPPKLSGEEAPALFCSSTYIKKGAYDGRGTVRLRRSGKAKRIGSGSDLLLYIGALNPDGSAWKRPVLEYGETFRRKGFVCKSRSTGLTCKRGAHGFFLSREKQRYF
jgi:hypothetical protein